MTRHISRAWNATNDFLTHVVECLWDWTKAATHDPILMAIWCVSMAWVLWLAWT